MVQIIENFKLLFVYSLLKGIIFLLHYKKALEGGPEEFGEERRPVSSHICLFSL
jgi:hypothetical protein